MLEVTLPLINSSSVPVLIYANGGDGVTSEASAVEVRIKNVTATKPIYIGASAASLGSSAAGYKHDVADGVLPLRLEPGEAVYGILAAGDANQQLNVLRTGR